MYSAPSKRERANDGKCVLYNTGQNKNQLPSKQRVLETEEKQFETE